MSPADARAYFERGFIAAYAWAATKLPSTQISDAVIDHAWDHRDEGMDEADRLPPLVEAVEPSGTDWLAARFAACDGLDWNEVCGIEAGSEDCDSSTCIAAGDEDHDPAACRDHYRRYARVALLTGGVA